jgi:hypothetical protein
VKSIIGAVVSDQEKILVVVHPGSALGSADSNLGGFEARAGRDALQYAFENWDGPVLVIHGELSDEFPSYPIFDRFLKEMIARSRAAGHRCEEVQGDDMSNHNQEKAITKWVKDQGLTPETACFEVTGAWYNEDGGGCVGSVLKRLRKLGYTAEVDSNSALCEIDSDMDDDDEEIFVAPVKIRRAPKSSLFSDSLSPPDSRRSSKR